MSGGRSFLQPLSSLLFDTVKVDPDKEILTPFGFSARMCFHSKGDILVHETYQHREMAQVSFCLISPAGLQK